MPSDVTANAAASASAIASTPSMTDAADPTAGGALRSRAGDRLFGIAGARRNPGENGIDCHHRLDAIVLVHDGDRVATRWSASTAPASRMLVCALHALERLSADHVVQKHLLRIARVRRPLIVCGHRVVRLHELARVRILQHQILEV